MRVRITWMVPLLAAASLAATTARDSRLVEAAAKADAIAVRALIKQGVDVNTPHGDGTTALHWAAHWNDPQIAELLIGAGASVSTPNDLGATPLWLACESGSIAVVERLLKAGANPNISLLSGESPLMVASRAGEVGIVKMLLAAGANVNAKESRQGQTALMWAAAQRHPNVVEILLTSGADIHARSNTWDEVVHYGTFDPRAPTEIRRGGYTALLFAAQQGDVDSARLLLAAGANVNDAAPDGASALIVTAHSGHAPLGAFLLEKGADANTSAAGYTPLHAAILRRNVQLVSSLIARGANLSAPVLRPTPARRSSRDYALGARLVGATPFWLAAHFKEAAIMRVLAANGADPLFVMKNGRTSLMAVIEGTTGGTDDRPNPDEERLTLEAVKVALELGINIHPADTAGNTAIHFAASKHFDTVVELLVAKGAKVDVKNKKGETPLALGATTACPPGAPSTCLPSPNSNSSTAILLRRLGATE
jgi:ankyrin repeat protein